MSDRQQNWGLADELMIRLNDLEALNSNADQDRLHAELAKVISQNRLAKKAEAFDQIESYVNDFPNRKAFQRSGHVVIAANGDFPEQKIDLYTET